MFETSLYEDGPFLDSHDLGFKTDPSDIFSLTLDISSGGWESHSPPDSPTPDFTLSSFCDPTLLKPTKFFEEDVILPNLGLPERIEESSLYSTWDTPPASPISDSSGCDDWLGEPLPLFGSAPSTSRTTSTSTTSKLSYKLPSTTTAPAATSHKRKSYAMQDTATTPSANQRKKIMREKSVQDRAARTAACERAVSELATQHSNKREDDPETRRHTHNILERKRRNDLKNSYQHLREHVPSLEDNERAPTGQILLHAVDYINSLKQEQANIGATLAQLKSQNEMLRRKMAAASSK